MYNRITNIVFKENLIVIVTFRSGEIKEYDFKKVMPYYSPYKRLENKSELFFGGHIAPGGSGIIFDDEVDIPCEELYDHGILIGNIEDLEDIASADAALKEYEKNPKTYTLDEIKKELKL